MENEKIGIMADSHSGILKQEAEELDIHVLPMPFYLNGELFHEDWIFPEKDFMKSYVKEQMFQLHSLPHRKLWKCGTKCFYPMIRSSTFR